MSVLSWHVWQQIHKGADIMIIKRSIDEISPELTKEQMEQLEKAEKAYRPGRKIPLNVEPLTLYLSHETMDKARKFGDDYVSILSRMLDDAVSKRVAL